MKIVKERAEGIDPSVAAAPYVGLNPVRARLVAQAQDFRVNSAEMSRCLYTSAGPLVLPGNCDATDLEVATLFAYPVKNEYRAFNHDALQITAVDIASISA